MCSRIQRINIQTEIIRIIDALRRLNHALDDVPQADSAEEILNGIEERGITRVQIPMKTIR